MTIILQHAPMMNSNLDECNKKTAAVLNETMKGGSELKEEGFETTENGPDTESLSCPLFMDGLPSDFSTNPSLAALASLLDEEGSECKSKPNEKSEENSYEDDVGQLGGGKVARRKTASIRSRPYPKNKKKTSMGEAQLFMKMWKL